MIVILMGVSGSGKTTIGEELARRTGWKLLDADTYHPAANIEKMGRGVPLEDADRWPWLDRLNAMIREAQDKGESTLLACSALKARYRDRLAAGIDDLRWVYLKGDFALIEARLLARKGHYMKAGLLQSQFAALEEPNDATIVDIAEAPAQIAERLVKQLGATPVSPTS
jgi:gluconokinase